MGAGDNWLNVYDMVFAIVGLRRSSVDRPRYRCGYHHPRISGDGTMIRWWHHFRNERYVWRLITLYQIEKAFRDWPLPLKRRAF
jgi:hypothetical protein